MITHLQAARLHWREDGTPESLDFNDIYFMPTQGVEESQYVFIDGNRLAQRWQNSPKQFTIAETGFGTGLNFLLAAELWLQTTVSGVLHFVSIEKHPLRPADLRRALAMLSLAPRLTDELILKYPYLVGGLHRLHLADGRIVLDLWFDDVNDALAAMRHSDQPCFNHGRQGVDAWFLDGFAPKQNPEMWSPGIAALMADSSHPGTTLASFTVAAQVKNALGGAGFSLSKRKGFGRKREMLCGTLEQTPERIPRRTPHFPAASWYVGPQAVPERGRVAIIGAGLAGCHAAAALRKRGFKVQLFDDSGTAGQASANPAAALYPRLSAHSSPANDFALAAYCYALSHYRDLRKGAPSGLIQLLDDQAHLHALQARFEDSGLVEALSESKLAEVSGLELRGQGLFLPDAHSSSIPQLCEEMLLANAIDAPIRARISSLRRAQHAWQLLSDAGETFGQFQHLILCNGVDALNFEQAAHLPLRPIRGQTSQLATSAASAKLKTVVCGDSYITPAIEGFHTVGSSYVANSVDTRLSADEHLSNYASAERLLGSVISEQKPTEGHAGLRCTTPDYLPLVGPLAQLESFKQQYSRLEHDRNLPIAEAPALQPGLHVMLGLGSRGLCFAPLCAEQLASQICGELSPLPSRVRTAVLPERFIIRKIIRRRFAAD